MKGTPDDSEELFIDDSTIINIKEYNSIKDEIICEICQGILVKPKQCDSCESIFCENCINKWLKKNNSCPKRCPKFTIKDCPRLMKKLLEKLVIECPICKKEFNYDFLVYKHYDECLNGTKFIKCPFCPDCQIEKKTLEEYQKNFTDEKNKLLKEIQTLKDKIKELEEKNEENIKKKKEIDKNKNNCLYKWSKNQKKKNFQLTNDDKTLKVEHSGCYTIYVLNQEFFDKNIYSFGLLVNTFGKLYDHLAIGFINEIFNKDCFCCKPSNSFYLRVDEQTIYSNNVKYSIKIENKTFLSLLFILNLFENSLEIRNYDNNCPYGKIEIKGNKFQFFVSKCNYGIIEYTLLPSKL